MAQAYKRYVAVGCSHGSHIDPEARDALIKVIDTWKPTQRIHLGDAFDFAALRSGAQADPNCRDRSEGVGADVDAGVSLLTEMRATDYLLGNHEARVYKLLESSNALIAQAAMSVVNEIDTTVKKLKARVYPYHIKTFATLGDTKFLHGVMCNVSAVRDHAETYGRCVIAHIHRTGIEQARTLDGATGYSAGMLMQFGADYASTRRATHAWKQGIVFGEFNDQHCTVNIIERAEGQPWRLPF